MKIYVITQGVYSDYGIVGVTLDKVKAEEYVKRYNNGEENDYFSARVETYETGRVDQAITDKRPMYECLGVWGEVRDVREIEFGSQHFHREGQMEVFSRPTCNDFCITLRANDKEHAIKAASEIMERYMVQNGVIAR